jgi:serine/threonine-protein kinase
MFHYAGQLDYPAALDEFEKARRALPNEAKVLQSMAAVARRMGRWEDATRHFQVAVAMDPRNPVSQVELAQTFLFQRRYADAARTYDDLLAWKPDEFVFQRFRAGVDVAQRADHRRLQSVLTSEAAKTAPPVMLARVRYDLALAQRDYRAAEEALSVREWEETNMTGYTLPPEWQVGVVASGLGNAEKARTAFLAARERAAADVAARPQDAKARMILARIEARLGNKDAAIREGERALAELPPAKDTLDGVRALGELAAVYAELGESGRTLDLLEQSAKLPAGVSYGYLKLGLPWETLRHEPRFQKVLDSLAPRDTPP